MAALGERTSLPERAGSDSPEVRSPNASPQANERDGMSGTMATEQKIQQAERELAGEPTRELVVTFRDFSQKVQRIPVPGDYQLRLTGDGDWFVSPRGFIAANEVLAIHVTERETE